MRPSHRLERLSLRLVFSAISTLRGYCSWDVDHASSVVTVHSPEEQTIYSRTLEEALAWYLVWLMAPELGVEACLV